MQLKTMENYNPKIHHRRSIRLKGYDYSQHGLYFITICCQDMTCMFGRVVMAPPVHTRTEGLTRAECTPIAQMKLNDPGKMVESEWLKLPERFKNIRLHEFIVMPNHFHGILEITVGAPLVGALPLDAPLDAPVGAPNGGAPTRGARTTLGEIVGAFQSIVTVNYIRGVKTLGWKPFNGKLWQRNYWEIIIRNEQSYQRISEYIINNPKKWAQDKFYNGETS